MKRFFEVIEEFKNKNINLPKRSTEFSAGYDFEAAEKIEIPSIWKAVMSTSLRLKPTMVRTGIKAKFPEDEALFLYNRSSNPGKFDLILANSVGVGDSDYYNNPDNEGEILFSFYNLGFKPRVIEKGQKIGQGIFQKFLLVDNDNAKGKRISGHGSTGK